MAFPFAAAPHTWHNFAVDLFAFLCIAIAIVLIIAPSRLVGNTQARRNRRLKELQQGAHEDYFEERRDLETYRFTHRFKGNMLVWRLAGLLLVGAYWLSIQAR
jgi:hypothetical protein